MFLKLKPAIMVYPKTKPRDCEQQCIYRAQLVPAEKPAPAPHN